MVKQVSPTRLSNEAHMLALPATELNAMSLQGSMLCTPMNKASARTMPLAAGWIAYNQVRHELRDERAGEGLESGGNIQVEMLRNAASIGHRTVQLNMRLPISQMIQGGVLAARLSR
jgi:hypothetical protein